MNGNRRNGWPRRVRRVVRKWQCKQARGCVKWGEDDCIQLGLDIAKAIYGKDPVPEMRRSYSNYADGYKAMRRAFVNVADVLDNRTSGRIEPDQARLGDLALTGTFEHGQPVIHVYLRRGKKVTFSAEGMVDTSHVPVEGVWRI